MTISSESLLLAHLDENDDDDNEQRLYIVNRTSLVIKNEALYSLALYVCILYLLPSFQS